MASDSDKRPVDQTAIDAALKYWDTKPDQTVAALERLAKRADEKSEAGLDVLSELLQRKEWAARIEKGLMPYHVGGLDELFFRFTRPELERYLRATEQMLRGQSASVLSLMHRCCALYAAQQVEQLPALLKLFVPLLGRHAWANVTFDEAFYEGLARATDDDVFGGYPPVTYSEKAAGAGPVIYLGCDSNYFRSFALPMLRSLAAQRRDVPVHLHLMDADPAEMARAQQEIADLGLAARASCERLLPADKQDNMSQRAYFHSARFVRLYQQLQREPGEYWLFDVDGLFNRDPAALFAQRAGADIALRARPGRIEPWNQFNACVVGAAPTAASLAYLRMVAAYIASYHKKGQLAWGIDQLALYAVYRHLAARGNEPRLAFLDDRALDYADTAEGILWCNSGTRKLTPEASGPDHPRHRYDQKFRAYSSAPA